MEIWILFTCSFLLATFVSSASFDYKFFQDDLANHIPTREEALQELAGHPEFNPSQENQEFLRKYVISHARLNGTSDSEITEFSRDTRPLTLEYTIRLRNAQLSLFGRFLLGVCGDSVLHWLREFGLEKLAKMRELLYANMFSKLRLSELIDITLPGVEVDNILIDAFENFLIRAELTKKVHRKHKKLIQLVFEPMFRELPHFLLQKQHDFIMHYGIPTENFLALYYYMCFRYKETCRDELIMRYIAVASIQELFDSNLLSKDWFFSELTHLRDKVCDIPSIQILPPTRNMNMNPDLDSGAYISRKEGLRQVMEDESNLEVVRDISTLGD